MYLIKHLPWKEYVYIGERGSGGGEDYKELYPDVVLHKDIFYKILDKLSLDRTKEAYCNYLIINEGELSESENYLLNYLSKKQINKFKSFNTVKEILEEEYAKKLKGKPRLVSIS